MPTVPTVPNSPNALCCNGFRGHTSPKTGAFPLCPLCPTLFTEAFKNAAERYVPQWLPAYFAPWRPGQTQLRLTPPMPTYSQLETVATWAHRGAILSIFWRALVSLSPPTQARFCVRCWAQPFISGLIGRGLWPSMGLDRNGPMIWSHQWSDINSSTNSAQRVATRLWQ